MDEFKPTEEQEAIIHHLRTTDDNILINAYAGCGKTSTLDLIQAASPQQPVLCIAFNKLVAQTMQDRFPKTTEVRTFNSLGHRVWSTTVGRVTLDKSKTYDIYREIVGDWKGKDSTEAWEAYSEVATGVGLAKALGYVPDGTYFNARRLITRDDFHAALDDEPTEFIKELIDLVLTNSIKQAYKGLIDFNDQIYMPALFGGSFPLFPTVLVDEDQDMSPVNHAMLDKLVNNRFCAVGDRWQSIYAFRGAVAEGIDRIKEKFNMVEFGLTVSFRCPRAVVEHARWRVPDFKWVKDGGSVGSLQSLRTEDIEEGSAIICRNNAPILSLAFHLLSNRRSVQVAGTDIGPRVINLLKKIGNEEDTQEDLVIKINSWRDQKLERAQHGQSSIVDMAECMKVFVSFGRTLSLAIAYAEDLFKREGTIHLTTGHKAKGLEWDKVYFLDQDLIKDNKDEQEKNLRYVIQTRAKEGLSMINSRDIH